MDHSIDDAPTPMEVDYVDDQLISDATSVPNESPIFNEAMVLTTLPTPVQKLLPETPEEHTLEDIRMAESEPAPLIESTTIDESVLVYEKAPDENISQGETNAESGPDDRIPYEGEVVPDEIDSVAQGEPYSENVGESEPIYEIAPIDSFAKTEQYEQGENVGEIADEIGGEITDAAIVGEIADDEVDGEIDDDAIEGKIADPTTVGEIADGETVREISDGATVGEIADGSTVGEIADGSTVGEIADGETISEIAHDTASYSDVAITENENNTNAVVTESEAIPQDIGITESDKMAGGGEITESVLNAETGEFTSGVEMAEGEQMTDAAVIMRGEELAEAERAASGVYAKVSESGGLPEGHYYAVVQEGPDGQMYVQQREEEKEEIPEMPGVIYAGVLKTQDGTGSLFVEGAGNIQMGQGSIISVTEAVNITGSTTGNQLTGIITSERVYGDVGQIAGGEYSTNAEGIEEDEAYGEEAEDYPEESEGEFMEEESIKPKKKRHVCVRCGQHFDTWIRMCEHRSKHGKEKRLGFQCKKCGEHFRLKVSLAEHSCSRMRRRKCCPCPRCGVLFFKKEYLLWHMWHHPVERKFSHAQEDDGGFKVSECGECGARFKRRATLTKHMIIHTGKHPFICEECGSAFTQQGHIRRHLASHKDEVAHPCIECGAKFKSTESLTKHLKKHDDGINVMCEECGQIFERPSDLREHKKEHTGITKFSCGMCGYDYSYFPSYKKHLQQHQSTEYQCPDCGIMVNIEIDYEDHCDTHGGEVDRSYICELCGATFGQSFKLKQHLIMHELKTGYECIHCQATYKYFASFRKHMLMHGVLQYLCPICNELVNLEDETASHLCRGEAESEQGLVGELSIQDEVDMITASNEMEEMKQEGIMNDDGTINMQHVIVNEGVEEGDENNTVVQDLSDATIVEAMQDPTTGQLIAADGTILQNMQFTMEGLEGATAMVDENNTVVLVIADGNFSMEDLAQATEEHELQQQQLQLQQE